MFTLADMRLHPRFAAFRQATIDAGSDSLQVFGGEKAGGYYVQQNPDEFAGLLAFLTSRCKPIGSYVEIGVAAGGTTRLIHEQIGFERGLLIDDGNHPNHRHLTGNIEAFAGTMTKIIGDSHSSAVARLVQEYQTHETGRPQFDVAFIDGDHSYEGVQRDIALIKPYCRPTTLLIFHDTVCCPGVKRAFAELPDKLAEFVDQVKPLGIGVAHAGV